MMIKYSVGDFVLLKKKDQDDQEFGRLRFIEELPSDKTDKYYVRTPYRDFEWVEEDEIEFLLVKAGITYSTDNRKICSLYLPDSFHLEVKYFGASTLLPDIVSDNGVLR